MKRLRVRLVLFTIILALFFFVEQFILRADRLPIGLLLLSNSALFVVVVIFLASPRLTRALQIGVICATALLLVATRLYFLGALLWTDRLIFLTTVVDVAFLVLLSILARQVADSLADFAAGVKFLTVMRAGESLASVREAEEQIQTEITRSRHYQRPLTVIAVDLDATTWDREVDRLVAEVQEQLAVRHTYVNLAGAVRKAMRPIDLVLDTGTEDLLLVLCPEADAASAAVLAERVNGALSAAGVAAHCATATFPDEGLTFMALVNEARARLRQTSDREGVPAGAPEASGHLS